MYVTFIFKYYRYLPHDNYTYSRIYSFINPMYVLSIIIRLWYILFAIYSFANRIAQHYLLCKRCFTLTTLII